MGGSNQLDIGQAHTETASNTYSFSTSKGKVFAIGHYNTNITFTGATLLTQGQGTGSGATTALSIIEATASTVSIRTTAAGGQIVISSLN